MSTLNTAQPSPTPEDKSEIRKVIQDTFNLVDRSISKLKLSRDEHAELSNTVVSAFQGLGNTVLTSIEKSDREIASGYDRRIIELCSTISERDSELAHARRELSELSRRVPHIAEEV